MNDNRDAGWIILILILFAVAIVATIAYIANSESNDREANLRQTYVCLEPDPTIPGRCLLAVHKPQQCWRFEVAPNQLDAKTEYAPGQCMVISK